MAQGLVSSQSSAHFVLVTPHAYNFKCERGVDGGLWIL